jgi:excisionase family DNA binding protein
MNVAQNARDTSSAEKIDKGRESPRLAYSVMEIVRGTSLSKATVYKSIRLRKLRSHRVGARRVILPDDLQRWLAGKPPTSD